MAITIKGNFNVGEQTPQPVRNEVAPQVTTLAEIRAIAVTTRRAVPVKTYETIDGDIYERVEEAELIKHYNKRSPYLSDMIQTEEIK